MTDDQAILFMERFVVSFEKIAAALEGLHETYKKQVIKPERMFREAVVTRVPSQEDRIREAQGASGKPLSEWLGELEDEEEAQQDIGVREREWLDGHAGAAKE